MKKRSQALVMLASLSALTFLDRVAISSAARPIMSELGISTIGWGVGSGRVYSLLWLTRNAGWPPWRSNWGQDRTYLFRFVVVRTHSVDRACKLFLRAACNTFSLRDW